MKKASVSLLLCTFMVASASPALEEKTSLFDEGPPLQCCLEELKTAHALPSERNLDASQTLDVRRVKFMPGINARAISLVMKDMGKRNHNATEFDLVVQEHSDVLLVDTLFHGASGGVHYTASKKEDILFTLETGVNL